MIKKHSSFDRLGEISQKAFMDLGPQCPSDDRFKARMRRHQSWYRANILKAPYGVGPERSSTKLYGNMLTPADGAAGKNFLTPAIHECAKQRLQNRRKGDVVKPYRLLNNMLSSQPMCFNLFAPLADDLDLATRLVRALWGSKIAQVTKVCLEWAPDPKDEYLNDLTAFDAFIEYKLEDGTLGFIGIETKLSETFSNKVYDRPEYRRWMTSDSPWGTNAPGVEHNKHNQLWRDHLLSWALQRHSESPYSTGAFCVIYHPEDSRCAKGIDWYLALLRDTNSIQSLTLDRILSNWRQILGADSWLDEFAVRYLEVRDD